RKICARSRHDALPISKNRNPRVPVFVSRGLDSGIAQAEALAQGARCADRLGRIVPGGLHGLVGAGGLQTLAPVVLVVEGCQQALDRKSTRLNSSHVKI